MDQEAGDVEQVVRATPSPTLAGDWALVLASAGIAHRLVERDGLFALLVAGRDAAAATEALAAFDAESAPVVEPPAPDLGPSALGVAVAGVLAAMFAVTGAWDVVTPSAWFEVGRASAEKMLHGQWWRAVTALTLHADLLHLAGNVVASLLFVSAVGRWLGAGLGGAVILAAATGANLLTALVHGSHHESVGASTATFAALGVLSGLQVVRRLRYGARGRRAWLPLAAGLGLFAMTGVGEHADVLAHLFGLGVGAAVGIGVAVAGVKAPGWMAQVVLGVGALGAIVGAWMVAFR
jgi:membrane associated rhomboid family serine protease